MNVQRVVSIMHIRNESCYGFMIRIVEDQTDGVSCRLAAPQKVVQRKAAAGVLRVDLTELRPIRRYELGAMNDARRVAHFWCFGAERDTAVGTAESRDVGVCPLNPYRDLHLMMHRLPGSLLVVKMLHRRYTEPIISDCLPRRCYLFVNDEKGDHQKC